MKTIMLAPTPVESRISEVRVYLSGAQVTRTASVPITPGLQSFIFAGLPAELDSESIQAFAENGVIIRSIEHSVNPLHSEAEFAEIAALRKNLKDLERKLLQEKNKIELGILEENMFAKNMDIAGQESGLRAEDLKSAVLFYVERMSAIRDVRMASEEQIEELGSQIAEIRDQLASLSHKKPKLVSNIIITTSLDEEIVKNVSAKTLRLSYYVSNASWQLSYDIRAKDISSNISLYYKGRVSQNTGENWENVKLILSTGKPSRNRTCPELHPWYLDFQKLRTPQNLRAAVTLQEGRFTEDEAISLMYTGELPPLATDPQPIVRTESVANVEYNIIAPCTIVTGGRQDVEIVEYSLRTKYLYSSICRLEREVFLLATIRDWEHLNLVAAEANVFFENRYIGKTYIDPLQAGKTINLSLGSDKSVLVTRVRGKDNWIKTLSGANVNQTVQWDLTVRNLKAFPIEIELKDQIPISVNEQITVNVEEISGADIAQKTGILTWNFALNPAETRSMTIKYTVSSPKEIRVLLE